jgi:pyrrolidone-carboxylate peptidase
LLAATLWHGVLVESEDVGPSVNAGDYLCNYLLYRALRKFPVKRIGFVHAPPFSVIALERQTSALRGVIEACSARATA